jgi:hypothetical protein
MQNMGTQHAVAPTVMVKSYSSVLCDCQHAYWKSWTVALRNVFQERLTVSYPASVGG